MFCQRGSFDGRCCRSCVSKVSINSRLTWTLAVAFPVELGMNVCVLDPIGHPYTNYLLPLKFDFAKTFQRPFIEYHWAFSQMLTAWPCMIHLSLCNLIIWRLEVWIMVQSVLFPTFNSPSYHIIYIIFRLSANIPSNSYCWPLSIACYTRLGIKILHVIKVIQVVGDAST